MSQSNGAARAETSAGPRVGWLLGVADAVALALLAAALWTLFWGSSRFIVFGAPLSLTFAHAAFAAALVLTARHTIRPQPSLLERVRGWCRRIRDGETLRVAAATAATRPLVLLVGYLAVVAIGVNPDAVGLRSSRDPLTDLPFRYDAGWYGGIAVNGYDREIRTNSQRNSAFFPAYPLLMRAVGASFGMYGAGMPGDARMVRALWSGIAISLAAFFLAMWYFVKLSRDIVGDARAWLPPTLLAAYPFAVFFSAAYTESLFLLGTIAAVYHFRRDEHIPAALWGLLVGLTRPNGFFLSVALAIAALMESRNTPSRDHRKLIRSLVVAAAPALGMLAFTIYLRQVTGIWFAWRESHLAWGRTFQGFGPIVEGISYLESHGLLRVAAARPIDTLDALSLAFALAMIVPIVRHVGAAWAVFVLINVVPPLFAGGLMSMGRITSTLFPVYIALAAVIPARAVPAWATGFALLQGLVAVLFFTWRHMI
ncbi:MAG TPA: mannosyltransferase family protein [Vicinamibacterales bacterium]|nr:mannosyltransferase family protein [Vicinamibacterales bacterium]